MRIVLTQPGKYTKDAFLKGGYLDRTDTPVQEADLKSKLLIKIDYDHDNKCTHLVLELPLADAEKLLGGIATKNSTIDDPTKHSKASIALDANYKLADCLTPEVPLLKTPCPFGILGLIKPTEIQESVTITDEMVKDYRDDLLLNTTYCNEAEAYLLAQKLGTSFVICTASGNTLETVIRVGIGPTGYLLYGFNHYIALRQVASKGAYTLEDTKFDEDIKTRVDGSCLLDACHIARFGVKANDIQIKAYREWLSINLDATVIRCTLTTILIDSLRGIPVAGLGPKTQFHYDSVPHRPRALRLLNGSPNPIIRGVASHSLMLKINEHKGPLVFRRNLPSVVPLAKTLKSKSKSAQPTADTPKTPQPGTLEADPVTVQRILEKLKTGDGDTLEELDGAFNAMGAFTLTCSCKCKQCIWGMLEIRIVPVEVIEDDPVEVLLGSEFSFTDDDMRKPGADDVMESDANLAAQQRWYDSLKSKTLKDQAGAAEWVVMNPDTDDESKHVKITYTDGWWFQVSLDVSCLELQTCPITLKGATAIADRMKSDIFDFARNQVTLVTDPVIGGGHIHLGLEHTFQGDARLFRNFVVDLYNHPLMMEVLDHDPVNAPVLGQLPNACREAFIALLAELDGRIGALKPGEDGTDLILAFAEGMRDRVLTMSFHPSFTPKSKLQSISFQRISETVAQHSRTIEIRSIRAQRSAAEFILLGKLFETRLTYLRRSCVFPKKLILYENKTRGLNMSSRTAIQKEWTSYLEECGLDPSEYAAFVKANLDEREQLPKDNRDYSDLQAS